MRRTRLLCAIGVSLWSAVVIGNQSAPSAVLSGALRSHVSDERFGLVTSIRGLPLGVRDALQTLFGSLTLDIAEPGADFQATDVTVNPNLPIRRLVAAGCSIEYCLVYYDAAVATTRGWWRCFTGRRRQRKSSGVAPVLAAWQRSTTFGRPSCRERIKGPATAW
jgi:hypothetical protein